MHVSKKYESFKGAIFFANLSFLFSGSSFKRTRYFVVFLMLFNRDVAFCSHSGRPLICESMIVGLV